MPTFQQSREFLLANRTNYDKAVAGFQWPEPVPFNWALEWFDAELARAADSKDRCALWIVDVATGRETKLTFAQSHFAPKIENLRKTKERVLVDEIGSQPRKLSLGHVGKTLKQRHGNHAVERRVANEFQPLVVIRTEAAMRQRLLTQ